jgi:hypothetical protein
MRRREKSEPIMGAVTPTSFLGRFKVRILPKMHNQNKDPPRSAQLRLLQVTEENIQARRKPSEPSIADGLILPLEDL